ncbi:hypothetical protein ACCT30_08735, partial [Rhizobium ruizarguesonis]
TKGRLPAGVACSPTSENAHMNSSIIMFSNMFSDIYFYKHCKRQSLLQCDRCRTTSADSFGADLFGRSRKILWRAYRCSDIWPRCDIDRTVWTARRSCFSPERIKLGLASAGPFS